MSPTSISRLSALSALACIVSLTGCGIGTEATNTSGALNIRGSIFGGQQPVSGATIKLYTAGKTGNGSAATSMLVTPRTSAADGTFNITGDYACVNANDQVYIAATGGNPGLASGTNNAALVMITALGRCADLPTTPFVSINELTTVAAAWALAPFIGSVANIGASSTNAVGLTNGFLNAALLVDPRSGNLPVLPLNLTVESGKINALANSIASCVNSDGTGCSPLFTAATVGSHVPTDTLAAALNIVRNPGNNVAAVYNAAGAFPPFPTTQGGVAPNDWTMSLTVTGGGLNAPTSIGVDQSGNVWAADYPGVISGFTAQGTPFNATGYGVGVLQNVFGLTIDNADNVWATSRDTPVHSGTYGSVSKFNGVGSGSAGQLIGTYFDTAMDYPGALSADTNGNIMIANYANSLGGEIYNTNGGVVASSLGAGLAELPVAVAADASHGMWLPSQSSTNVLHIAADGTILANTSCCVTPSGVAVDAFGNAWVANYGNDTLTELSPAGTVTLSTNAGDGGVLTPDGLVIDGAQDVWAVNFYGGSFSHIAGNGGTASAGTALSSSNGFGLDASLVFPYSIAVDPTGNVWVGNKGGDDLVMFFGLATPTKTPMSPTPVQP